jgi:hypothetical protein
VDLYQGDDAPSRRRTVLPDAYAKVMEPELAAAAERLRNAGHRRIVINGAFRLPTAFAIGAALPRTRGTVLIRQQLTEVWDTNAAPEGDDHLRVNLTEVGDSADIAVVVAVTNDPTQDVAAYLSGGGPQIGAICTILPGRAHDASVSGPGHSVILCQAIRHHVRDALRNRPGGKVHLFMACPGAMALFLGHRWNRVASTIIYEDLSPGYAPTFSVSA